MNLCVISRTSCLEVLELKLLILSDFAAPLCSELCTGGASAAQLRADLSPVYACRV